MVGLLLWQLSFFSPVILQDIFWVQKNVGSTKSKFLLKFNKTPWIWRRSIANSSIDNSFSFSKSARKQTLHRKFCLQSVVYRTTIRSSAGSRFSKIALFLPSGTFWKILGHAHFHCFWERSSLLTSLYGWTSSCREFAHAFKFRNLVFSRLRESPLWSRNSCLFAAKNY